MGILWSGIVGLPPTATASFAVPSASTTTTLRVGLVFGRILALVADLLATVSLVVPRLATIVASILHVVDLRIGFAGG